MSVVRMPGGRAPAALAVGVTLCGSLPVFLTGALSVQLRADLGFSASLLGVAVAAYFAVSAVSSAYMGHAAQRIGLYRSMGIAAALACGSMLVAAAAFNYASLVVATSLAGLSNALAQPAANGVIIRDVPEGRRGLSFGIKQSAIPIATLTGGLAVPLVALTVGWRWAYLLAAIGAAGTAILALRQDRDSGTEITRPMPAAKGGLEYRPLLVLSISAALGAAAATNLGSFVTASAVDLGASEAAAGLFLAGGSILGISMRLWSGWISDRRVGDPLTLVAFLLAGGTVGYALMSVGWMWLFVPGVALAFGLGWSWPAMFQFAVSRRNPATAAAATGVTQSGVYLGGVTGPIVFGLIVDHGTYTAAWLTAGTAAACAAVGITLGRRMLAATPALLDSNPESQRGSPDR
ncbi:MAG: MFS transporter [Dehalococcoidia bacterium]|nr:MFS transporter [Dehalococcoidia bacterium]